MSTRKATAKRQTAGTGAMKNAGTGTRTHAGALAAKSARPAAARVAQPPPWAARGERALRIRAVRAIVTAPEGTRLVVVKVETNEPGLYGVGCATFSQRAHAVATVVDDYLAPLVMGRDPDDINDIWQAAHLAGYWRGGPIENCALSGLDQALWDIKAKRAGVPLHQLFGGRCRSACMAYVHVKGEDFGAIEARAQARIAEGFRCIRLQPMSPPRLALEQPVWDGAAYARHVPRLFEHMRHMLGEEIELIHDVHERLPPAVALALAKDLEPYRLFYLEDLVAPEDNDALRLLRAQTSVPLAMGELYASPHEYLPPIRERLIDFIRVHVACIGGVTPARKLAAIAEAFGVRAAWHGPDDVSPVGHAAQLHLSLATPNFGVQEAHVFGERAHEVFPGMPELRDGSLWASERPGLGIDIDERKAAKYPPEAHALNGSWPSVRDRDGGIMRP